MLNVSYTYSSFEKCSGQPKQEIKGPFRSPRVLFGVSFIAQMGTRLMIRGLITCYKIRKCSVHDPALPVT